MKVRVFVVGDLHVAIRNFIILNVLFKRIYRQLKKNQYDFIVLLGDILDTHERINVKALMKAEKFIGEIRKKLPTYVIIGNHDRPNNSVFCTNEHPFNSLKEWANTKVIDTPLIDTFGTFKRKFAFAPYVEPGKLGDALALVDFEEHKTEIICLFGHQEIEGCNVRAGPAKALTDEKHISQKGDHWPKENPLLISGHIHEPQRLAENMIYTGAPYQVKSDESPDKSVSVFTFDDEDGSWTEEKIFFDLPKKVSITVDYDEFLELEVPDLFSEFRVKVVGKRSELVGLNSEPKYKELIAQKVMITKSYTDEPIISLKAASKIGYHDYIRDKAKKDERCLRLFNKLLHK